MASRLAARSYRRLAVEPWPDTYSRNLVYQVCCLAGSTTLLGDRAARRHALGKAVARADTPALFDWLMGVCSYQGISDQVAESYLAMHGNVTWAQIEAALSQQPQCKKLRSFWHFSDCRYDKARQTCSQPQCFVDCPVPKQNLRNGRLNQTAYSLFLFIRDIANNDLVGWIDGTIAKANAEHAPNVQALAVVSALRGIFGVSDKVLAMALSSLFLTAKRPLWREIGANMIAVDTLVHNFLHRTGILLRANARTCLWRKMLPAEWL